MKDPIERQDAIDELYELYEYMRVIDPTEAADLVRQGVFLAEKKIENMPSAQPDLQPTCNQLATDLISRQALCEYALNQKDKSVTPNDIMRFPSAQPEIPPYVAEIEAEYKKWINVPYIRKPLAKALHEVWKKHDREDTERRTDG